MKKLVFIFFAFFLLISCSSDSSSNKQSNNDGKGGSLAIFALKGDYLYAVDEATLKVFSLLNEQQALIVNSVQIGF